jgi:hypothetical protein
MKARIIVAATISFLIIILLPVALIVYATRDQGLFILIALLILVYLSIYVFGGVAKLVIYFIYGLVTMLSLLALPVGYQLPMVIVGTLLFVLNPLAGFESYLESSMRDEDVLPIRISLKGSYWPYYAYRRDMKNYYHLPQARKLYTQKWYLHLRQLTTILFFGLGIFLLISQVRHITNTLNDFNYDNFFVFYIIVVVFILTFFSFKKGFTSTFRLLVVCMFPVFIYLVLVSGFDGVVKLSLSLTLLGAGLAVTAFEVYKFYQRVTYDSYSYTDLDQQMDVHANALFEPYVYNETFTNVAVYTIRVKPEVFRKRFHDILVHANFHRFFITAYTEKEASVNLHCDFHFRHEKRADLFKTYLEAMFRTPVPLELKYDPDKLGYEETFFHRPPYIVARAQHLASLLKELEIESKIILSMVVYFENRDDLTGFSAEHPTTPLEEISSAESYAVRVDVPSANIDYMIEAKVQDVLLTMMTYKGRFVRISVYY